MDLTYAFAFQMNYSVKQLTVLMAILLVLVTVGSGIASFLLLENYYHTEESRLEVQARQRLNLAAKMIGNQVLFYQEAVDLLAGRGNMADLLSFSEDDEVERWALQIRTTLPGAFGLALARRDGQIIGDPLIQRIGNVCQDDLKHFANNESVPYPPYHHEIRGLEHFDLFSKVETQGGEDGGVLLVSFHTDTLLRMLQRSLTPGDVLSIHTNTDQQIARTGPFDPEKTLALKTNIPNTPWNIRLQTKPISPSGFYYQFIMVNLVMLLIVIGIVLLSTRRFAKLISTDMQRVHQRIDSILDGKFNPALNRPTIAEIASLVPDIDRVSQTMRKQHEELLDQSLSDPLTGLHNRRYFDIMITRAFDQSQRRPPAMLLVIDLNNFKLANDSLGHEFGDQILRDLADCLKRNTRNSDEVARIGGDEFAVILQDIAGTDIESWVREFARRYDRELQVRRPQAIQSHCCTLSIGVAMIDAQTYRSSGEAVHAADQAMYAAKSQLAEHSRYHIATTGDDPNNAASTT